MRFLWFVLFFLVGIGFAFGQDAPKNSNLICVNVASLAGLDLFTECKNLLKREGYFVEKSDDDLLQLITAGKNVDKARIRILLDVDDHTVNLRAELFPTVSYSYRVFDITMNSAQTWVRVANKRDKMSKSAWSELVKIAEKIGDCSYLKE